MAASTTKPAAAARLCDAPGAVLQRIDEQIGKLSADAMYGRGTEFIQQLRRGDGEALDCLDHLGRVPSSASPVGSEAGWPSPSRTPASA